MLRTVMVAGAFKINFNLFLRFFLILFRGKILCIFPSRFFERKSYQNGRSSPAQTVLISFDVANFHKKHENAKIIKHVGIGTIYPPL